MRFAGAPVIAALLFCSAPALADDIGVAKAVEAEALFKEGRSFFEKGDFENAAVSFAKSEERQAAVGTLLNLGDCYTRLGRIASAWGVYREAEGLAATRHDERRDSARKEAVRLEPRLPKLVIAVEASDVAVTVTRNGAVVDAGLFDREIPVDPGPQRIVAAATNHAGWETTITMRERAHERVVVPQLRAVETSAAPPPTVMTPTSPEPRPKRHSLALPIALEITGGALLAGGLVFGAVAMGRWSGVEDRCPNATCANSDVRNAQVSDLDSSRNFATISTAALICGAVVAVAGVVIHVLYSSKQ